MRTRIFTIKTEKAFPMNDEKQFNKQEKLSTQYKRCVSKKIILFSLVYMIVHSLLFHHHHHYWLYNPWDLAAFTIFLHYWRSCGVSVVVLPVCDHCFLGQPTVLLPKDFPKRQSWWVFRHEISGYVPPILWDWPGCGALIYILSISHIS